MNRPLNPGPQLAARQPWQDTAPAEMDDDFIDLGRLLRAVLRYKWGILGLAFAIALATGLVVSSMEPVYRAQASIVLETQEANIVGIEDVYSVGAASGYYDYTETQYELLKARSLAERVVRKYQLHQHPVFAAKETEDDKPLIDLQALLPASRKAPPVQLSPAEREQQAIQATTDAVAAGVSVQPVQYSYLAYISYESTDPKLAALVANAIGEEFIASNLETRLQGTTQATGWLEERLEDLRAQVRVSEAALQDFRDREGLVDIEGKTSLGSNELQLLNQRLEEARKSRIEAQAIKEEVQNLQGASIEELMTIPAVLQHQLVRDLKREQATAEREVAELANRYGRLHPKMISAREELAAANIDLEQEVRKVVSGIEREYELAARNERQLQTEWEARRSEVQEFNRKEFELKELQRDVDTNRQLYEVFFTRLKNVSETGGFEKPHARIVDRAMVPAFPFKPNKRMSVILALVLGTMLGCGIAILLDMLDNTVKTPDDVQEKLHVPLLGTLPRMKLDKNGEFQQIWQSPQSHYAESVRTIRTGVVLSGLDDPAKVIVVTSTLPGEGKSTTVLNLGAALGQMENTLVIGADLRRPNLAKRCGLEPNHRGLSHFVSGSATLDECIEHLPELGIHVMPAGVIPPNPLEMISSRRFVEALKELRQRFDRVVIDSAPVQAVSDALVLASYADSVIYVVKADSTSATQAQKGIASIISSNEPLTGVVLNQFDAQKAGKYYGSKYYQYGEYYASEDAKA
jgi:capsular exopolysaccharide synthesis family protein